MNRLLMLQRCNDARLQASFGDLQVAVQTIYQIDQQALLLQLSLADHALQGHAAVAVMHGQLSVCIGVNYAEVGRVGSQGIIEQSADSFHPAYSLCFGTYRY